MRIIERKNNNKGMTVAEMLITVAIVVILAGVAIVAILAYQRSLAQLERDGTAKELFIAAQNHLTLSKSEGQLSTDDPGFAWTEDNLGVKEAGDSNAYCLVVNTGQVSESKGSAAFNMALPFGAIDETVRLGGNYIIRYQPDIGKVLDVFYCSSSDRFGHSFFSEGEDCASVAALSGNANKDERRSYIDGSVLGWYGGEGLETLHGDITPPDVEVVNGDTLYIQSRDDNSRQASDGIVLRFILTGKTSGVQRFIDAERPVLGADAENADGDDADGDDDGADADAGNVPGAVIPDNNGRIEYDNEKTVLDDITNTDKHFSYQFRQQGELTGDFIPGEDIEIRSLVFSTKKLANIAEGEKKETNSLFASVSDEVNEGPTGTEKVSLNVDGGGSVQITSKGDGIPDTAYISSIRHLENLDKSISNFDSYDTENKLNISAAVLTDNIAWDDGKTGEEGDEKNDFITNAGNNVYYSTAETGGNLYDPVQGTTDSYRPVALPQGFTLNGMNHSITGVAVNDKGNTGLLSSADKCTIRNMELIDFSVTSEKEGDVSAAGALAGEVSDSTMVDNVLARNSSIDKEISVSSAGDSGGLIGSAVNSTITHCAAALVVSSGKNSGGLIGSASASTVSGSYSGGHTDKGEYYQHDDKGKRTTAIYNVNGTDTAGGLIGTTSATSVSNCYSTASASAGTNGTAGGLIGAANGDIKSCYSTGLVAGKTAYAFVGSGTADNTNTYLSIINEQEQIKDGAVTNVTKLQPASDKNSGIIAFDSSAAAYKGVVGSAANWIDASVYDSDLQTLYKGKYCLRPINALDDAIKGKGMYYVNRQYGDWPSPDVFTIN